MTEDLGRLLLFGPAAIVLALLAIYVSWLLWRVKSTCQLGEFLQAARGRMIFAAVAPNGEDKLGVYGILEGYDDQYITLKCKDGIKLMRVDSVACFELDYDDLNVVEVVTP